MLPLRSRVASLQKSAKDQDPIEKVTHKRHPWDIAIIVFGLFASSIPNRFEQRNRHFASNTPMRSDMVESQKNIMPSVRRQSISPSHKNWHDHQLDQTTVCGDYRERVQDCCH